MRLPGAAIHGLEQKQMGWRKFPFYVDGLESMDDPLQRNIGWLIMRKSTKKGHEAFDLKMKADFNQVWVVQFLVNGVVFRGKDVFAEFKRLVMVKDVILLCTGREPSVKQKNF